MRLYVTCMYPLLRYNLTDRKTLQSYKFNYFIKQRVSSTEERATPKGSTVLMLDNLLKPSTVYILISSSLQPFLEISNLPL